MNKFFVTLYYMFLLAVGALACLLVVTLFPIKGNIQVKIVQSGSMEPTIRTGAIVIIKPEQAYKVGDIITFGKDTKTQIPTTHRVVADMISEGVVQYETKGDANEDKDSRTTPQSDVIGKVLFSIPFLGYLIDLAKKPWGFALIIGFPATLVIIEEIATIFREARRLRRKERIMVEEQEGI